MRPIPKILLAAALSLGALALGGCSASSDPAPALAGLSLATTTAAEAAFRPILKKWASALTRDERAALRPDLAQFRERFPDDGQVAAAEALLAWIAVEKGELVAARELARRASLLGAGSWQDFSTLVAGAAQRRSRDPRGALVTLGPLKSKLIDPWARDLLNEEIIAAAIAAGDSRQAVGMMSVWLREADDEERALVRSRVERALATLGKAELVRIFEERAARPKDSPEGEIDPLLAQRLAEMAVATRDAVLAQKLLLTSGALLGDRGDAVARLAAGAAAVRVDARTVGLLLSFRTAETRRRSAEVAAGVAWGLGLPGSGARLAVRDDAGDGANLEEALTELGRAGAAVVIAGIADDDARVAAGFARAQQMPVVLISKPADVAAPGGDSFVVALRASPQAWTPADDGRFDPWISEYGQMPSFWSAAGRDAAVTAWRSVKDLPQAATEDPAEVQNRRRAVRDALGQPAPAGELLWAVDPSLGPAPP